MPTPTSDDLATYIGNPVNAAQAAAVIGVVKARVNAWTRGVGFTNGEPNDELSAVIRSTSARLLINPQGVTRSEMGALTVQFGADGFSIPEQGILNRYRKMAL